MANNDNILKKAQELVTHAQQDMVELAYKSSIGGAGSIFAMNINELAGLIVAILTGIYMLFQIEAAWHKRKTRNKNK